MSTTPRSATDEQPTIERVRQLEAEIAALRGEIERKDAALRALAERVVPVEAAREAGIASERDARLAAEMELTRLRSTKLYRLALRPREAISRRRERLH